MKKSIIALIIAVMVVVVGGVVFLQLTRAGLPMENVIPSGALVYVKVSKSKHRKQKQSLKPFSGLLYRLFFRFAML